MRTYSQKSVLLSLYIVNSVARRGHSYSVGLKFSKVNLLLIVLSTMTILQTFENVFYNGNIVQLVQGGEDP